MDRQEAIQRIDGLFPVDAPYEKTAAIGRELLEQAKANVASWKNEPDEVLFEYARLCEAKDYEAAVYQSFRSYRR